MRRANPIAVAVLAAPMLIIPRAFAGDVASSSPKWELTYHSVVPIGQDVLLLKPGGRALSFLASAESIGFEGWRLIYDAHRQTLLAADGRPVEYYRRFVDFRVTVSEGRRTLPGLQPVLVNCESQCIQDTNEYLLRLQFRVKIFRALQVTVLQPKLVELVGVPGDVRHDERIYRLAFDLGEVPLADRIVLEVLSPEGERLTRFHLDM